MLPERLLQSSRCIDDHGTRGGGGVIHAIDVSYAADTTTTFHPTRCALGANATAVRLRQPHTVEASVPADSMAPTVRRTAALNGRARPDGSPVRMRAAEREERAT